jgi:hypothetical protein
MIYHHNHIPRTAGTFIYSEILPFLKSKGIDYSITFQNKNINDDYIKSSSYIFGHIGCYPELLGTKTSSFAIIREPSERFISTFNFFSENIFNIKPTIDILEKWLYDPVYSDKHSNLQSKFLTGSSNKKKWNNSTRQERVINGWMIEGFSTDIEHIKNKIDTMKIATLENKDMLLDWISNESLKEYGFKLYTRRDPINESSALDFKIPESMLKQIKELNSIDYHIYDYVKSNSKKFFNGV